LAGNNMSNLIFNQTIPLTPQQTNYAGTDFVAIKMGDIDESSLAGLQVRSYGQKTKLEYDLSNPGLISISSPISQEVIGFQLSAKINRGRIVDVKPHQIEIARENYHVSLEGDVVKISWNSSYPVMVHPSKPLFDIVYESDQKDIELLNDPSHFNQWYTNDEEIKPIILSKRNAVRQLVTQNKPNPFFDYTDIGVYIENDRDRTISMTLYDALGKVINNKTINTDIGENTIRVYRTDLAGSGIYHCTIKIGDKITTLKLILTN
jgi:hypothetical protein